VEVLAKLGIVALASQFDEAKVFISYSFCKINLEV